jgi:hypothetical protein
MSERARAHTHTHTHMHALAFLTREPLDYLTIVPGDAGDGWVLVATHSKRLVLRHDLTG